MNFHLGLDNDFENLIFDNYIEECEKENTKQNKENTDRENNNWYGYKAPNDNNLEKW